MSLKASVALMALLVLLPSLGFAQSANNVNPEAIQFDSPVLSFPGATGFRIEVFPEGADPRRDVPVKTFEVKPTLDNRQRLHVTLGEPLIDVPNGRYMATVRPTGPSMGPQSEPSDVFVLSRESSIDERVAEQRRERFWTKVAIAIGGVLLFTPFLF